MDLPRFELSTQTWNLKSELEIVVYLNVFEIYYRLHSCEKMFI